MVYKSSFGRGFNSSILNSYVLSLIFCVFLLRIDSVDSKPNNEKSTYFALFKLIFFVLLERFLFDVEHKKTAFRGLHCLNAIVCLCSRTSNKKRSLKTENDQKSTYKYFFGHFLSWLNTSYSR